jgi:hypothetical protein
MDKPRRQGLLPWREQWPRRHREAEILAPWCAVVWSIYGEANDQRTRTRFHDDAQQTGPFIMVSIIAFRLHIIG